MTVPKFNSKNRKKGEIDTPKTQMHDRLLSWLGTDTSIKSGGVKLVLKAQTLGEMIRLMKKKLPQLIAFQIVLTLLITYQISIV